MKKRSRIYLITVLFIAITLSVFVSACEKMPDTRPEKIDEVLWEQMQNAENDELIPVTITIHSFGDDVIIGKIKEKTGYDPDIYMNESRFQSEVAGKIKSTVEKIIKADEAVNGPYGVQCLSSEATASLRSALERELKGIVSDPEDVIKYAESNPALTVVNYIVLKSRVGFQNAKLRTIKALQTEQNDEFIEKHVKNRGNTVKYASIYTPTIQLSAKKADIVYYSRLAEVVDIHYDDPNMEFVN